ncbi:response regulator transcription factor [Actinoplanes xinjiangensis]|uniref:DNA-binding NarL/FixJ family response regulator n=1 Tax=Actinoplanes xinjiangensis TaxID=512350 RepID=A0A316EUZ5_9ACTN|nr:response regulator transcription factor [Actinoplanes xinjiangensis]PWK36141.1 DNA-binding NarL/FixJ family response regulator [Actinoplanes xinjiangensis]
MTKRPRIAIADDSVLLRSGIARLLEDEGIDVVAEVGDVAALLAAIEEHQPDLAIVDVRMPPTFTDEGIHAALRIREAYPHIGVLVLSQWVDEKYATELLSRGTHSIGYLLKDRVPDIDDFVDAVHRVLAGGSALDPEVVQQLVTRSRVRTNAVAERLSSREYEVLGQMAQGLTNNAIAERLFVAPRSVEKHIRSIFAKLDLAHDEQDHNRRVLAVLRYLESSAQGT